MVPAGILFPVGMAMGGEEAAKMFLISHRKGIPFLTKAFRSSLCPIRSGAGSILPADTNEYISGAGQYFIGALPHPAAP